MNNYKKMFGNSSYIYDGSEKEFIRVNPICKDCLIRVMCIKEIDNGHNIKIRVCEKLYKHFLMVKKNDRNLNKGENNAVLH